MTKTSSESVMASAAAATDATSSAGATEERRSGMSLDDALLSLDDSNEEHWNKDGTPKMAVLEDLVGSTNITRADAEASPNYRKRLPPANGTTNVDPTAPRNHLEERVADLEADVRFLRSQFCWPNRPI